MRHNRIAITVEYGCVSLRMQFFPQNFGTIKRILPGSSSPSHREGPGTEVGSIQWINLVPRAHAPLGRPRERGLWVRDCLRIFYVRFCACFLMFLSVKLTSSVYASGLCSVQSHFVTTTRDTPGFPQ